MQSINLDDDYTLNAFLDKKKLELSVNTDYLISLNKTELYSLLDILLPYTITLGSPFKTIDDFISALLNKHIVFLPDTNILFRAEEIMLGKIITNDGNELETYKILMIYFLLSMFFNLGSLYMPALLEIIDSEENFINDPNLLIQTAYEKLYYTRYLIECSDYNSLKEFVLGKVNSVATNQVFILNKTVIVENIKKQCSALALESFFHGHNQLENRIFQRSVAYCYMCKAYIYNKKQIAKIDKISAMIDWIKNDFVYDPISLTFSIMLFTNKISFPKKRNKDVLKLLDNQARDILYIRDFLDVNREIRDKNTLFLSLDKKLLKLFSSCFFYYDESDILKVCLSTEVFSGCKIGKKNIMSYIDTLEALSKRKYPTSVIKRLDTIKIELEVDIKNYESTTKGDLV